MSTLEEQRTTVHLQRGRWLLSPDDPILAAPYLALPHQGYVSGFWALSRHDMIDQVPRAVEVATTGRSRTVRAAETTFELRHIEPRLFDVWELVRELPLATAEKALFDAVYFHASRGATRVRLPEIELPVGFDAIKLDDWVSRIASARVRTATTTSLSRILELAREPANAM
jgi:predicted transcriptional regulator of viral defense system